MERYANPKSGVEAFEISEKFIAVKFWNNKKVYVYTDKIPGSADVEHMKALAQAGEGLATYISQFIKERYDHTR